MTHEVQLRYIPRWVQRDPQARTWGCLRLRDAGLENTHTATGRVPPGWRALPTVVGWPATRAGLTREPRPWASTVVAPGRDAWPRLSDLSLVLPQQKPVGTLVPSATSWGCLLGWMGWLRGQSQPSDTSWKT